MAPPMAKNSGRMWHTPHGRQQHGGEGPMPAVLEAPGDHAQEHQGQREG